MRPSVVFRLCCILTLVGAWIRIFSQANDRFYWILTGWVILSMPYPFFLTSMTLVCNTWLGDRERTLCIQLLGLCVPVGTIIAFLNSGIIFENKQRTTIESTNLL